MNQETKWEQHQDIWLTCFIYTLMIFQATVIQARVRGKRWYLST